MALEAGLLSRACPRALPCGAASCPTSTAARSTSPDEPDAGPIAGLQACGLAEHPNLAVLVRQLGRYGESELSLCPPSALTRIEERVAVYRTYLQQVRGFAPSTVANHGRTAGESAPRGPPARPPAHAGPIPGSGPLARRLRLQQEDQPRTRLRTRHRTHSGAEDSRAAERAQGSRSVSDVILPV